MTAGSSGDSENLGAWKTSGQRATSRVPPIATKTTNPSASAMTTPIEVDVDAALIGHADGDGEQDHGEDVVDHGRAEDRARRGGGQRLRARSAPPR